MLLCRDCGMNFLLVILGVKCAAAASGLICCFIHYSFPHLFCKASENFRSDFKIALTGVSNTIGQSDKFIIFQIWSVLTVQHDWRMSPAGWSWRFLGGFISSNLFLCEQTICNMIVKGFCGNWSRTGWIFVWNFLFSIAFHDPCGSFGRSTKLTNFLDASLYQQQFVHARHARFSLWFSDQITKNQKFIALRECFFLRLVSICWFGVIVFLCLSIFLKLTCVLFVGFVWNPWHKLDMKQILLQLRKRQRKWVGWGSSLFVSKWRDNSTAAQLLLLQALKYSYTWLYQSLSC